MQHFKIQPRLFLYIFLAFIGCTVIGTLSHEAGHFAVAKTFGYEPKLSYQSVRWRTKAEREPLFKLAGGHIDEIRNNKPFPGKAAFDAKRAEMWRKGFLTTFGGPFQTMLTGTIGFFILLYRRKKYPPVFNIWNWIAVFLAFFWVRQPGCLVHMWAGRLLKGHGRWFGGDERRLSLYLDWPPGTMGLITGIIGSVIVAYVVLVAIPQKFRFTFITAGICGGVTGFVMWMGYLGPYLLP